MKPNHLHGFQLMTSSARETVLVTGASSGIGLALARCFAKDGCRLVLVARNVVAMETLAQELRQGQGVEVLVLNYDLARAESPRRLYADLSAREITVDILVNNAGFGANGDFAEIPVQRELDMVQVNVTALMELTALFLPAMITRNRGGILNVGSVAGFTPGPGMTVYFATKAFVQSFTEGLAEELSATNLAVSVLCPGPTESNFGQVAQGEKKRQRKVKSMTSAEVAIQGHRQFRRRKLIVVTGWSNYLIVQLLRILPRSLPRKIVRHYNHVQ